MQSSFKWLPPCICSWLLSVEVGLSTFALRPIKIIFNCVYLCLRACQTWLPAAFSVVCIDTLCTVLFYQQTLMSVFMSNWWGCRRKTDDNILAVFESYSCIVWKRITRNLQEHTEDLHYTRKKPTIILPSLLIQQLAEMLLDDWNTE